VVVEGRRRTPSQIRANPRASPLIGSHGMEGIEALAAGNGVVKLTTTAPTPALTAGVSTAPAGP
jgi:hypothetical protein